MQLINEVNRQVFNQNLLGALVEFRESPRHEWRLGLISKVEDYFLTIQMAHTNSRVDIGSVLSNDAIIVLMTAIPMEEVLVKVVENA